MKMAAARIRVPPTKFEEKNDPSVDCELHILKRKDKAGFSVRHINDQIGKGVFTKKAFRAGEFLLEYTGELISKEEAHRREKSYPLKLGSFLFFFKHRKKELCIDGTFSKGKGRYINDGCGGNQNSSIQLVMVRGRPHLAIFATRNIKEGEEILYDYGVPSLPWRKNVAISLRKKTKGKNKTASLTETSKNSREASASETLETSTALQRDDDRRLKEGGSRSETPSTYKMSAVQSLLEQQIITKTPKGSRDASSTETYPSGPPFINYDVQEDKSKETTSKAQTRYSGLRRCSVVVDKLICHKDRFHSISKSTKRRNIQEDTPTTAQTNNAFLRLSSTSIPSGIPSGVKDHHISTLTSDIVPKNDYALTEPDIAAANVDSFTIVPSIFDQVSRKAPSIQIVSTQKARETLVDKHLLNKNSEGLICISNVLSTNKRQRLLAANGSSEDDVCSQTIQNLTNEPSAFRKHINQMELGEIVENPNTEAPGREPVDGLARDVGAFNRISLTKVPQLTVSVSTPENICLTTASKQDSNSGRVTSEMISGSVTEVCGTILDLSNESKRKANVTIIGDTVTKEHASKINKVTAEPIPVSVVEAFAPDVLSQTTANVRGEHLATKELEKQASVSSVGISPTACKFKPTVPEHNDVSIHGTAPIGSLSVSENPFLKVTMATSQQMTNEPQSISILECSGSDNHLSVVAQDAIAVVETTQDVDVDGYTVCDICGKTQVDIVCRICNNKQLCGDCDTKWHSHPRRQNHKSENLGQPKVPVTPSGWGGRGVEGGALHEQRRIGLPEAPLYLTVQPGYSNALLTWDAPSNNNGGDAVDSYIVMMKTNGSNWCRIAKVNSNIKQYTVENLQPSIPYRFCVSAENCVGSGPSVEVQSNVYLQRISGLTNALVALNLKSNIDEGQGLTLTNASPSREAEEIYLSYGTLTNELDKECNSDQVHAGQSTETIGGGFAGQNEQGMVIGGNTNDLNVNAEDLTPEPIDHRKQSKKSVSDAGYSSVEAGKKRRPYRPCPYCHSYKSDLSGHIARKHADEDVVKKAVSLPRNERIRAFRQLKKEGIMKTNMQILRSRKEGSVKLLRERQPRKTETGKVKDKQRRGSAVVYCSECHGFVDSKYFSRHRKSCMSVDASTVPQSMPTSLMYDESDNGNYKRDILRSFHKDSIGKICVTDDLIVRFGYREFKTIRTQKDKQAERRATLKTKMRRLGTLFACFKRKCHAASVAVSSANDMFKRKNFTFLEDTIYTLTTENGDKVKNGLKIGFGYVLKSVCKYLHGEYLIQGKDAEATEMNRFLAVLNYHWASIFGDAEYANTIKRQEVLRKPQKLPKEQDIKTLRDYTLTKIQDLTNDTYLFVANTEYSLLRDLVVSRLTLFNARRGGEPSRLLLDEWNDALNDVWYNNTETVDDPLEKFLLGRYKLAYQSGKRVKLVPLLIVADCWKAMEILANPEVRKQANVFAYNRFVFPNTRLSPNHVSGWKAVEKCCQMAELDNSITATQMRHYVATVYAALEIPDEERKQFYEHMGHSEAVNKNVYQSPLALKEVVQVGGFLHRLDKGQLSETVSRRSSSSEASINDTGFTEMNPLTNTGCNGDNQQHVRRSDSRSISQTCTNSAALYAAEHSVATSLTISTTSDRCTQSPVVIYTRSDINGVPPYSSMTNGNPTGTSAFVVSSVPTKVQAIENPVTISSPTLTIWSPTEVVSDAAHSSNPPFEESHTTACVSASVSTDHVGVEQLSGGICNLLAEEQGNTDAEHREVSSPDSEVFTAEPVGVISYTTRDKLAAMLNQKQRHRERSAIVSGVSRSKTTTPKDSGSRSKNSLLVSSRYPDPQDMDYSDSGSSCQSTPTKKRIYRTWSTDHTKTIQKCFERYIKDTRDIKGNTGPLPRTDEVKVFIKEHPEILQGETITIKIARIKTKVFNERKELRRKLTALEGNPEKR